MKREKTLQRGVCVAVSALFAAALCAAPLGVSANSALYEWQGSIAGGVTVQEEDCPVVVERERLVRLPAEYPYPKDQAMTMMRKEWPDMTDEQFQALMDNGRVDWRFLNGQIFCHDDFIETSRNYPLEAPGLKSETEDTSARDQMLARMKAEGGLAARITIRASIQPREHAPGARIQAWLPIPAACLQQSEIELL